MKLFVKITAFFIGFLLTANASAGNWVSAYVITKDGTEFSGEIKAGKRTYSTAIRFRDKNHSKKALKPDFVKRIITDKHTYQAIYFNKEVSGYNMWAFGKVISEGCINIYDVNYPFKNCSCKTSGSYVHSWVLKIEDKRLQIVNEHFITNVIKNISEVSEYLKPYPSVRNEIYMKKVTREELLYLIENLNDECNQEEINRTYSKQNDSTNLNLEN